MAVNELKEVGLILFPLLMLAAMIYQAVTFINPMVHDDRTKDGICMIANIYWDDSLTCFRDKSHYFQYWSPIIYGTFIRMDGRPTINDGEIFVENDTISLKEFSHMFIDNKHYHNYHEKFIMDVGSKENDLSDETLWNCLTETLVEMKELIVGYLPQFDGYLDVATPTVPTLSSYPDVWFNCSMHFLEIYAKKEGAGVFLYHVRTNKIFVIPFLASLGLLFLGLYLITKYSADGPIKQFSLWLLQLVGIAFYIVLYVFYVVLVAIIWEGILQKDSITPEKFFEMGSIFFPIVWLCKKIWKACCAKRPVVMPSAEPRIQPTTPRPTVRPNTPPQTNTTNNTTNNNTNTRQRRVSFASDSGQGTVLQNMNIEDTVMPPPVYPDSDSVLPPPIYHDADAILPPADAPPPSYDDVIQGGFD